MSWSPPWTEISQTFPSTFKSLSDSGLVGRRREGTSILYAISDPMVFKLCALVCSSEAKKSRREFEELSGQRPQGKR